MDRRGARHYFRYVSLVTAFFLVVAGSATAFATTSTSPNYQVVETEFNSGTLDGCSGEYCARASIGDLVTSGAKSGGSASFSNTTGTDPLLEVIVEPGQSSVGTLSSDKPTTKTALIKIRNYLSGGYTLQLVGEPPKFGNHVLSAPSTPTSSTPGTEQFAINLVANVSPIVGKDPVQVPANQVAFGVVEADYATPNLYKYVSEDVVARSTTDWGQTEYTVTMLVNVSNKTPAGHYSGDFAVIAVPAY